MFAGPNGSGKSTIRKILPAELLGVYINPDEIQQGLTLNGFYDLSVRGITTSQSDVASFYSASTLLAEHDKGKTASGVTLKDGKLRFPKIEPNAYIASVTADFVRRKLIEAKVSFSFETVMSHEDKVELLRIARQNGYRTYLYYVATEDPVINISRVENRVSDGGHDVPKDKIVSRYWRSLDLLLEAIRLSNRAYIFDNSGRRGEELLVAEVTDGELELKTDRMPAWFKRAVWDKLSPTAPR